jgi:hypothetical protein
MIKLQNKIIKIRKMFSAVILAAVVLVVVKADFRHKAHSANCKSQIAMCNVHSKRLLVQWYAKLFPSKVRTVLFVCKWQHVLLQLLKAASVNTTWNLQQN